MAGSAGHQWKHNWIPLTPAAALVKAKGSKTTAAKLRQKHGVKSPSSSGGHQGGSGPRRLSSVTDGTNRRVPAPVEDGHIRHTNDIARKHNLPFRQGDTVKVRSIQGKDLGAGKFHGLSADGKHADVIYGDHTTPRRIAVNYIAPADGRAVRSGPAAMSSRDRISGMSDSKIGSELTKSSNRGITAEHLRREKASRSIGRPADIPTPDTTVAASSRRAAIAKMSDAQLADLRKTASNGQTQRFAADEQAKRAAKVGPDTSGIPVPDGYKVRRTTLSNGAPGGYEIVDPDGRSRYAGTTTSEAARAARVDFVQRQQREADLQARRDAHASQAAAAAAREAANREIGMKQLKTTSPEELATHRERQMLRDRNRYQRGANNSSSLSNDQLKGIIADPDATTADKDRARADLEANAFSDARRRLAGVADADLPEAKKRIDASNLPPEEKAAARKVIAQRLAAKPRRP